MMLTLVSYFALVHATPKISPEQSLYEASNQIQEAQCGAGSCVSELKHLSCHWEKSGGKEVCTYENEKGEHPSVRGAKAADLLTKVRAVKKQAERCDSGKGRCEFTAAVTVMCRAQDDIKLYECKFEEAMAIHAGANPPAKQPGESDTGR